MAETATSDLITLEKVRRDVFLGLSRSSFWKLRTNNKKTMPKTYGVGKLFMSEKAITAWRDKYWNRGAA